MRILTPLFLQQFGFEERQSLYSLLVQKAQNFTVIIVKGPCATMSIVPEGF